MNQFNSKRSLTFFVVFILFFVFGLQAQNENSSVNDSIKVSKKVIQFSNISDETERIGQRISDLREILKPSSEIKTVDSLLNNTSKTFRVKKDSLLVDLDKMNKRELKASSIKWNNYRSNLKSYQKVLKQRTEEVGEINDEIVRELEKWQNTKEELLKRSGSRDVYSSLDTALVTLKEILELAHSRLDKIFILQKRLTELVLITDEAIDEIQLARQEIQKNYFVFDSKPIWKSDLVGIAEVDSVKTVAENPVNLIKSSLKENAGYIKNFISLNVKVVFFQVIFILFLFVLMLIARNKWNTNSEDLTNPIEIQAKIVLSHPISASIVAGLLISVFFYTALIPAFAELHIFIILLATTYLLPKLTNKRFVIFLGLIFIAYLIHTFEVYLGIKSAMIRWLLLIDAVLIMIALIFGEKILKKSPDQFKTIYPLFTVITPVYLSMMVGSIVANIIGMVALSRFLIKGVLFSVAFAMVIYLSVKVITSLFILFFKLRKSYSIQTFSNMVSATHKRIQPILNIVGLIVWIMFTLRGFEIYDLLVSKINELMLIHWEIGEMTISFGGILAFLGIFIITLFLSKLAATIFQDEWMVEVLPRGIAPAISLILRIILISIGLYMALSAAGLDLSKLGFMLGALGVGIGFGLQNIVLNFVAGLILAFERPINLGDTIEIDQELGVVTSIGVRSSNIKSYSGYEAIIPNGDLISKKVINYTLTNRDRRSKILMKTSPDVDPEKIIGLFNEIAAADPRTKSNPPAKTYFYGYDPDGNLSFALLYWTTFSDTLKTDNAIALKIFAKLKEEGIDPPAPMRRIVGNH